MANCVFFTLSVAQVLRALGGLEGLMLQRVLSASQWIDDVLALPLYDVPASFSFAISVILGALNDYLALRAQHGCTGDSLARSIPNWIQKFKCQSSCARKVHGLRFAFLSRSPAINEEVNFSILRSRSFARIRWMDCSLGDDKELIMGNLFNRLLVVEK